MILNLLRVLANRCPGSLHVLGIGIGFLNHLPDGVRVTRSLGVLIAGAGVWFLYKAVAL